MRCVEIEFNKDRVIIHSKKIEIIYEINQSQPSMRPRIPCFLRLNV